MTSLKTIRRGLCTAALAAALATPAGAATVLAFGFTTTNLNMPGYVTGRGSLTIAEEGVNGRYAVTGVSGQLNWAQLSGGTPGPLQTADFIRSFADSSITFDDTGAAVAFDIWLLTTDKILDTLNLRRTDAAGQADRLRAFNYPFDATILIEQFVPPTPQPPTPQPPAVPEPATWAMMIAGFGAVGAAMRRRRRRRAVAA